MQLKSRKQTKAAKVLEDLRQDILSGRFQPGEKLQMEVLKQRYHVGYSPLREALSNLASRGLVLVEAQCGFRVATLSLEELYDLYAVRAFIETKALELSLQHGDDTWEADVVAIWHRYKKYLSQAFTEQSNSTMWNTLQKEFQDTLIKACLSPWLLKIRQELSEQALRYRSICLQTHYSDKELFSTFIKENDDLVSAVLARDISKAIHITQISWKNSAELIAAKLQNNN